MWNKKSRIATVASSTKSYDKSFGRLLLIIFAIILGMSIVAYGLHIRNDRTIKADKARFVQAEKDVAEVSQIIKQELEIPDVSKERNECTRSNREFGNDTFSCNVGRYYAFSVTDYNQVNMQVENIRYAIKNVYNSWKFIETTQKPSDSTLFLPLEAGNKAETLTDIYATIIPQMKCDISYDFYKNSNYINPTINIHSAGELTLLVSIGCGSDSLKSYY